MSGSAEINGQCLSTHVPSSRPDNLLDIASLSNELLSPPLLRFGPHEYFDHTRFYGASPDGYALNLDSTRLLHEDGHQEGVAKGYTRMETKPCLHPLLAVLSEVRLVEAFWLRAGNRSCPTMSWVPTTLAALPGISPGA
jgi:hypothetical protein